MGIIEDIARTLDDLLSPLVNVSVRSSAGLPEDMPAPKKTYPPRVVDKPLIDVIRKGNKIRIIATLAGIREEDFWYEVRDGILAIEITGLGRVFRKEIPCSTPSGSIYLKSAISNNSILELVFVKKRAATKKSKDVADRTRVSK